MNKKKVFDPRVFYRKLENHFKKNPLIEDNPSSIIPTIGFLYTILRGYFRVKNIYLYEKKDTQYINIYRLLSQKNDFAGQSYDVAEIMREISNKESLNIFKNVTLKEASESSIDLFFMLFGTEQRYMIVLKAGISDSNSDQLYYLLSSFKYLLNQHLKFSFLESNFYKASEIQNNLIPKKLPDFKNYDIAAMFIPAEMVGGDVYDFIQQDDDLLGILIADASGHGLPAALQARDVIIGIRMGLEKEHKIWSLINKLNKVIFQTSLSSRFVSLFYAEIENDGLMTYVNAGHCNPIYFHSKKVKELDVGGLVLGWTDQAAYKRGYHYLEIGSVLVLYTDGINETRIKDDDEYGTKRLMNLVKKQLDKSSSEILVSIIEDVKRQKINSEWEDDVSLIVIKRLS